jgi:hypothetical protein
MTRGEYKAETIELEKNVSSSGVVVVEQGLAFILSHFSQPLWPRKVSTAVTNKQQYAVDSIEQAMLYFNGALWEDCRISAYGVNQTNPNLIFIDLDRSKFSSLRSFKLALTTTLKNIKEKLGGGHPTILWSGRGYHIIQPINCPIALENIKELAGLEPETSTKFLQFAERYLSSNKNDKSHHPALRSCQLRIPGSINSRCKAAGMPAEVKIIQEWDGFRPDYRLLIGRFYADLVGKKKNNVEGHGHSRRGPGQQPLPSSYQKRIDWIEKLLQTPIDDNRKHVRDLILVPYLLLVKGVTDHNQISSIVMQWADKCSQLRRLDPSRREFERRVRSRIYEVLQDRVPPMRFGRVKDEYPDLYEKLNVSGGKD